MALPEGWAGLQGKEFEKVCGIKKPLNDGRIWKEKYKTIGHIVKFDTKENKDKFVEKIKKEYAVYKHEHVFDAPTTYHKDNVFVYTWSCFGDWSKTVEFCHRIKYFEVSTQQEIDKYEKETEDHKKKLWDEGVRDPLIFGYPVSYKPIVKWCDIPMKKFDPLDRIDERNKE
jgi:hypothetical protein